MDMKKTIIQRIVFLLFFTANVLFANAQAYEYVCKKDGEGYWTCSLKNLIKLQDNLGITFELSGKQDRLWMLYWRIYDRRESGRQFVSDADMNKNSQVVVYLENGLNFTFRNCLSTPYEGHYFYMTDAVDLLNGKQFLLNDNQRQSLAMELFRSINITKISFDDKTIYTPKMRSAETFEAMAQDLMTKTGDPYLCGGEKVDLSECLEIVNIITDGNNKVAGEKYMANYAKQANVKRLSGGVLYKVIKAGSGRKPQSTSMVKINYKGNTIDGDDLGDTFKSGEPMRTRVNQLINGIGDALQQMPVGSIWEMVIPYDKAYGENGAGPIKPYSALIFKIELLRIEEY